MVKVQIFCVNRDHGEGKYLGNVECTMEMVDALLDHFPNLGINILSTDPEEEE